MEPRHRSTPQVIAEAETGTPSGSTHVLRLVAASALLVAIAFVQDPGFLVDDTKFDLVVNPTGFLSRALHLWDAQGAFGQVQNQSYGYLWPMGPFFLLGHWLGVAGWIIQRAWLAVVLVTAFVGAARVARALGIRSDLAVLVTGFAYALSPRILTTLGPISIEAWPSALAPWVLLPLIIGSSRGSPRRAAALSALAVGMVGGVNAAATFAAIPLGVVWLLTRSSGPRRRIMMLWWPAFTLFATLWWLVPLFLLGNYSPPFLDYIESTTVTTLPTTLFDALRGSSDWVPYIDGRSRAGNDLITQFYAPLNSGVLLMLGLTGLMQRGHRHRQFLTLSLLTGLLLVTMGHTGAVHGWFAADVKSTLDAALAPLRNVHKFDPIIRLPLVLGVGLLIDRAVVTAPVNGGVALPRGQALMEGFTRYAAVGLAMMALLGSVAPAALGRITPAGPVLDIPEYWQQAEAWLEGQHPTGTTLLAPGSSFGDYLWGFPGDEPLQFLGSAPWAVRNAIPLAPPGNIRMLDAIQQRFADGHGSVGLTDYLRRAGVRFLLVRNDLQRNPGVVDPVLVHETLAESPGIRRVKTFGPEVGGAAYLLNGGRRIVINQGWQASYPALEVYEVADAGEPFSQSNEQPIVVGGPEDLLGLADIGIFPRTPTVLAMDTGSLSRSADPLVLTDGYRRREKYFAGLADSYSAVVTPGDTRRNGGATSDYLAPGTARWQTTAVLSGARSITASSSESDAGNPGGSDLSRLPYAAVDGTRETSWISQLGSPGTPSWRVGFDKSIRVGAVRVTASADVLRPLSFRVEAHGAESSEVRLDPGQSATVQVGSTKTSWLRVVDTAGDGRQLGLAEVEIPGISVRRYLRTPSLPESWGSPDAIVLSTVATRRGCAPVGLEMRCINGWERSGEEDAAMLREVPLRKAGSYSASLAVRPRPGSDLDSLVQQDQPLNVIASSTMVDDPQGSALAAIDSDPGTTWISTPTDVRPQLRMNWLGRKRLTGIDIKLNPDAPAQQPTQLELRWSDPAGDLQRRIVTLSRDGSAQFPAIDTDQLAVTVTKTDPATSLGFDRRARSLGVGISQLRLTGLPYLPLVPSATQVNRPCGAGPDLQLPDGSILQTTVTASAASLYADQTVPARICGSNVINFSAGDNRIVSTSSKAFSTATLQLRNATDLTGQQVALPARSGAASHKFEVDLQPGGRLLEHHSNTNPGWVAEQRGRRLDAITLDGWQQGWLLDGSNSPVKGSFAPDSRYRIGLFAGGVLAAALVLGLAFPRLWRAARDAPAIEPRRLRRASVALLGTVGVGLLAGWWGVIVGALGGAVCVYIARRAVDSAEWLCALPVFVAGLAYAVQSWGSQSGWAGQHAWPQYLVTFSLGAVVALVAWQQPDESEDAG